MNGALHECNFARQTSLGNFLVKRLIPAPRMNSGLNSRARRRAEIEAEHARQKIMAENLEHLRQ